MIERYEVIPSVPWRRDDGATASVYGACPWQSAEEQSRWTREQIGWIVRNLKTGTVGIGRKPWKSEADARAWLTLSMHVNNCIPQCDCHQRDQITFADRDAAPYVAFIEGAECCYSREEMAAFVEYGGGRS